MDPRRKWGIAAIGITLIALTGVLAIFVLDFKAYAPHPWTMPTAQTLENSDLSTADFIERALSQATSPSGRLREGAQIRLTTLYSRDDEPTTIYLLEGTLNPSTIDPPGVWSHLTGPLMIVNPVDRRKTALGGIGSSIVAGCMVLSVSELEAMTEGDERIDPCERCLQEGGAHLVGG